MCIYSIGEALIDFMPQEDGFIPAIGGAPANVAACAAKLGAEAYFIGKVGEDLFGNRIIDGLQSVGVKTRYVSKTDCANTALAFVALKPNGDREFSFYRNPSADMFLEPEDVKEIAFKNGDILHFCSVDLIDMPVKDATKFCIEACKAAGGVISFDPNVRANLWKDIEQYRKVIREFIPIADIVKLASDECEFVYGIDDIDAVANTILETAKQVIITFGGEGSKLYTHENVIVQKPYPIQCVDTTGAGDTFIGTYLRYYKEKGSREAMLLASAASAMVCTKKGVLTSLPSEKELEQFMRDKNYE